MYIFIPSKLFIILKSYYFNTCLSNTQNILHVIHFYKLWRKKVEECKHR